MAFRCCPQAEPPEVKGLADISEPATDPPEHGQSEVDEHVGDPAAVGEDAQQHEQRHGQQGKLAVALTISRRLMPTDCPIDSM
jgi:hypothetical protein